MSDLSSYVDRYAEHQMREREVLRNNRRPTLPRPPRPRGRHALAQRLHALADRLDA